MWLLDLFVIYFRVAGAGLLAIGVLLAWIAVALFWGRKSAITWLPIGLFAIAAAMFGWAGFSLLLARLGQ